MKYAKCFLWLVVLTLFLCACGKEEQGAADILVSVIETEAVTVENNGQRIAAGNDAVFYLKLSEGVEAVGVDYNGEYRLGKDGATTVLEVKGVRYPSRLRVTVSEKAKLIHYKGNGASGEVTEIYDTHVHLRPNTSNGVGLFEHEGYTLESWNTEADGSGVRVGLGSRVTVEGDELTLYAQWAKWTSAECFSYKEQGETVYISGYVGEGREIVIPSKINGKSVVRICTNAFVGLSAERVVLPNTPLEIEDGAFRDCALNTLILFDNIERISDASFQNCPRLKALYINAVEEPYGYQFRRESLLADKMDLLICAQGSKKLVFYGGCSMWYNLNGTQAAEMLAGEYRVINLGLNGTVNSLLQMEMLGAYLEEGDIFFHAPELSSPKQLLLDITMSEADDKLWCGLEYNYDLLAQVDISSLDGVLDSLCAYLDKKQGGGSYSDEYRDSKGRSLLDETGGVPFLRETRAEHFGLDETVLEPNYLKGGLTLLGQVYRSYGERGAKVVVSYGCINMDAVSEEQQGNVEQMEKLFQKAIGKLPNATLISQWADYLYCDEDMYDSNYHLLTEAADRNTALWIRDLKNYLQE